MQEREENTLGADLSRRPVRPRGVSPFPFLSLFLVAILAATGCSKSGPSGWQGYIEGEFVYVSSPLAGRLDTLSVAKGARVAAGAPLFTLERAAESDSLRQASRQLDGAKAQLADLSKGSRPEEIAALDARLGQARAAAELSRLELVRQDSLFSAAATSASDHDRARLTHEADARVVEEESAQLETARLGGRPDALEASGAAMRAAGDAEARARWSVDQKAQAAPAAALVYDTLYREGEYVSAGSPVVALLPPGNVKVRFFVPEPDFARIRAGDRVNVGIEGLPSPLAATVSYLSPQPEYTPPVLYNRDNRAKLVYMVEAVFSAGAGSDLHPGQPVDVEPAAR
jgi:HlyD family secretion protein